ncbi:MAG: LytR/AlgR family response regulator transcription factor [Flavobacteriales bacterium]
MKITCLIIDDEPLARKRLQNLVAYAPNLVNLGQAKTGKEAIKMIKNLNPDLIFLDIQMKDMTGFDVLNKINATNRPIVIFVTAFDEYAIKAFDYFAFDYLLKPFKKERFTISVNKAIQHFKSGNLSIPESKMKELFAYINKSSLIKKKTVFKKKLPIKIGKTVSFIDVGTIKYICASGSYVDIHTLEKIHVLRYPLNNLMLELDDTIFVRIHRSTIINLDFIIKIIHSSFGEIDVEMDGNKKFRVSKSYKKEFKKIIGV